MKSDLIYYNSDLKLFSKINYTDIAKSIGIATAVTVIPNVIRVISNHYGNRSIDNLLNRRNSRYKKLQDKYNEDNSIDKTKTEDLKKELFLLVKDTLDIQKLKTNNQKNRDFDKLPKDLYHQVILPFVTLLQLISIKGIYIITGTNELMRDRQDFQIVYDPNAVDFKDMLRNPFKQVLFRYPWPAHGFAVKTMGSSEANKLISGAIDYMAEHPEFLSIRV